MEDRIARSSKGDVPWPDAHLLLDHSIGALLPPGAPGSLLWVEKKSFRPTRKKTLQVRTPSMARSFLSVCLPALVSTREGRHSQACREHPSWKFAIAGLPACRDLESASWIKW